LKKLDRSPKKKKKKKEKRIRKGKGRCIRHPNYPLDNTTEMLTRYPKKFSLIGKKGVMEQRQL